MTAASKVMLTESMDVKPGRIGHLRNSRVCVLTTGGRSELDYFVYLPATERQTGEILLSVHGLGRNAAEHAFRFAPYAEELGFCIIAPYFSRSRHRYFQKLATGVSGDRAEDAFDEVLVDFEARTGLSTDKVKLFGYSGGGQFAHRYVMLRPERISRLAIMAAGWFSMPTENVGYPHGIAISDATSGRHFDPLKILSIPTCVFVGSNDIARDHSLNSDAIIDQMQGLTRIERATNWVSAMNDLAGLQSDRHRIDLNVLDNIGHNFTRNMTRHGLGKHITDWLFPVSEKRKMK